MINPVKEVLYYMSQDFYKIGEISKLKGDIAKLKEKAMLFNFRLYTA